MDKTIPQNNQIGFPELQGQEAVSALFNSYCAIVYFRERAPAIFLRPQNIIKHALYGTLALYSLNPNLNPNQNRTHVPRYLLVWNLTDVWPLSLFIFSDENTKWGSILKVLYS